MSFSPKDLDASALRQLTAAFTAALQTADLPTKNASQLLGQALGHTGMSEKGTGIGERIQVSAFAQKSISPMSDRRVRQQVWRLLSAQMRAGIDSFTAVGNILARRAALGFSDGMDEVLGEWRKMLSEGRRHQDFFAKHVMPFDFKEGAELALNSRLGSFEDAIAVAACD